MSKLPGVLGDYVTVAMAVELLGFRKDQTGRFYALVKKGLPTYKVGGLTLAKFAELAQLAGLPEEASPPWPSKLAGLKMEFLHSRNDAAAILGVSPRTVNRHAVIGTIGTVDLSPWGGYTLYQLGTVTPHPEYWTIGDWDIEAEVDERGRLHINLSNEGLDDPFMMLGMASRSKMAYVHDDEMEPARAIIKTQRTLYD
jgi:hypothetical protein